MQIWTDGTWMWPNFHPAKLLFLNVQRGAAVDGGINAVCNVHSTCTEVFAVK